MCEYVCMVMYKRIFIEFNERFQKVRGTQPLNSIRGKRSFMVNLDQFFSLIHAGKLQSNG